jgi:glycosyltransferase involved in cell wall biosynthesis
MTDFDQGVSQKEFIFFTLNVFQNEGGGTIRMYGVVNELAKQGHKVTLISNANSLEKFHPNIYHISFGHPFSRRDKRLFQFVVGIFPGSTSTIIFSKLFKHVFNVFKENNLLGRPVYFFEYLDNTIGYLMRLKGWIPAYYNDLHGMPTLEFKFRSANAVSLLQRFELYIKYLTATVVDNKIYGNADGYIFATQAMKEFFEANYPKIKQAPTVCLPYLVSEEIGKAKVDDKLLEGINQKFNLNKEHFVILFAGGFKKTGGMTDLIEAVDRLLGKHPHIRLLLIGDGPVLEECQNMVVKKRREKEIMFVGRTAYHELRTYQEAADLLVCPDKQNVYSQLIIHVKYFDALVSGKLVINGSFNSVREVNPDDFLSVSFEPSDVQDLANKIEYCMENQDELRVKYKDVPQYVLDNFTYSSYFKNNRIDWF